MALVKSSIVVVALAAATLAACGDDAEAPAEAATDTTSPAAQDAGAAGLATVSPQDAAATIDDPPADLVVLDVRTPEEFAEGHLEGAVMLDFYDPAFADSLAELDPDVPYVLYCRSGNRSGQTLAMMEALGFESVDDVDGGIVAWQAAGLPVVAP